MTQFVSYHINGWDSDKTMPIATGPTREEAQGKAITRTLSLCIVDGSIGVQKRDDLSAEDFAKLTQVLDDWFAKKTLAQ